AVDVVELLGLGELVAQALEPQAIGAARLDVEHLAGVAGAQVAGAAQVERGELAARMAEELRQVRDSLRVLHARQLLAARERPHVAFAPEAGRPHRRRDPWLRLPRTD